MPSGKTDPQFFPEFGAPGAFSYDFRNGAPQVHPIRQWQWHDGRLLEPELVRVRFRQRLTSS